MAIANQIDAASSKAEGLEPRPRLGLSLFKARLREYLSYDSWLFSLAVGALGTVIGLLLYLCRRTRRGFDLLARLHRANYWFGAVAPWLARRAARMPRHRLADVYQHYVDQVSPCPGTARVFEDPRRMLGSVVLVLKSATPQEKGVIVLGYNHIFPMFARFFDVRKVASRYHIVLEPSWSGYCTLDVLIYSRYPFPVFVQAYEPRDAKFIDDLKSNLVSVPTSTNWWVNHRLFRPLPAARKDIDIIMIAAWARYKRHDRFFAALGALRRAGRRPRVVLLGYPIDL